MMVEEGFRVRFQNGEVIDFYADSKEEKERWMDALSEVVGKDAKEGTWCDLVVQRERSTQAASQKKAPAITTTTPAVQKPLPKPQSNALPPPPTTPSHQKPELRKEYPMAPPPPPPPSASASSKLMFSAAPAPPPPVRAETEQSRAAPMPRKPNFRADYHAEMNDRRTSQTNDGFSPARPSSQPGFQTSARLELGDAKASTTGARDFAQHVAYGMGTEQMLGFDASRRTPQAVRTGLVSPVKKPANLIKKKEVGKAGAGSRPKSMLF